LKIIRFIFFFFLCSFHFGFSQTIDDPIIDSINNYLDKSRAYQREYDIKKSIEYANKVIELSQEIDNEKYQFEAYNSVGISYELVSDFNTAEKNYQKALSKAEFLKNDTLSIRIYNNLGNVYSDGLKEKEKGLFYYNESLALAKKNKDTVKFIVPMINIAWTYIDEKEFEKAYPYLNEVMGYVKIYGNERLMTSLSYLEGQYYVYKKQYKKALKSFDKSINKSLKLEMLAQLYHAYLEKSKLLEILGQNDKAYEAFKAYEKNKEKVFNKTKLRELEIAKARFELDEFQRDLGKAKKENALQASDARKSKIITIASFILVLILIILLIILYKNYITKNELSNILKIQNQNLEKSKEAAEKLSKLKTQFISTVSHELRTPLYGVVGITSLLMEEEGVLSKKENEYLKSLKFSSDYLLNLINDVLQLSKIESNKLQLEKIDFNIQTLLRNVVNSFGFHLDQKKNQLELEIDENIPCFLVGDKIRLQQILINLVGNAIKFTSKGTIWLRLKKVKENDDHITINFQIEDNGIGIPEEKQEEIFDNFLQIEREDAEFQGTGLGLSIVKKLVTLFGGDIYLESEIHKGSKFCFTIDFIKSNSEIEIESFKELSKNNPTHKKILVVDDNKINRVVTQNILKKEEFESVAVNNGLLAIEKIKEDHFDLILMDLNMPVMNGFETTHKIREFNRTIPIIALTAVAIDEIKDKVFEAGLNDIINKPYDNLEFYQTILRNIKKSKIEN